MEKPNTPKPAKSIDPAVAEKRVFGSAKGQIIFKKGWDAPMTELELEDFLSGS
jgi:hypothetical protein